MDVAALSLVSVRALLDQALLQLRDSSSDSAELDAQLLLAKALGKSRSWLYAWPQASVSAQALAQFTQLVERRRAGEPVAYLLGTREFWSLELEVGPSVLIPRPETEAVVAAALELGARGPARVADLGTGSGAIALALAVERPAWEIHATEASPAALAVARRNAQRHAAANLQLWLGSWCEPLPLQPFDLIVSNPPYIAADDPHLGQGDVRFEPRSALVAEDAGLRDIRTLAQQAVRRLQPGGWLLVEHGWQQGRAVQDLLRAAGYVAVATRQDDGGRDRLTIGCKP